MQVLAIYKIDDRYVVGDNRKIYRLPFSANKRNYRLKEIKEYNGGYYLYRVFIKKEDINYSKIEHPYVLIKEKKLPF